MFSLGFVVGELKSIYVDTNMAYGYELNGLIKRYDLNLISLVCMPKDGYMLPLALVLVECDNIMT